MRKLIVNTKKLRLRDNPSLSSNIIGILSRREVLVFKDFSHDWYWVKVQREGGQTGWASYKYMLGLPPIEHYRQNDPRWLKIAFGEIGIQELADPRENQRILNYFSTCERFRDEEAKLSDETPWCSAFVNWVMEKSNYEGTNSAWAKSWHEWGMPTSKRRGAIAVFERLVTRNGETKSFGHVGFYHSTKSSTEIRILGGNQANKVNISTYPINSSKYKLLGFRKPPN